MNNRPRIVSRIHYNSPVILTFALLSLGILVLNVLTAGYTNGLLFSVYRSSLRDPLTYVRIFGHVLGHTSFAHYFGNMTLFLVIGPIVEEKYGSGNLLMAIAMTAVVTGGLHCLISPGSALLGASGVVFMLILLSAFTGGKDGTVPLTLILVALIYLGKEIHGAIAVSDGISQLAHIAGGGCGILSGIVLRKK